jgi:hypothetical protein
MIIFRNFKILFSIFTILIILGIWSPWNNWNINITNLFGFEQQDRLASLSIKSFAGDIDVYINDEFVGSTSLDDSALEVNPVEPGIKVITLKRKSENNSYIEIKKEINFEPGVEVVMAYEIGPSEIFSEGHVLYAKKRYFSKTKPTIDVFSSTDNINVKLNDIPIGQTPLRDIELDINRRHRFKFEKDGYDSLEIEILPESQEDRDKLANLSLVLDVNLFLQPLDIRFE